VVVVVVRLVVSLPIATHTEATEQKNNVVECILLYSGMVFPFVYVHSYTRIGVAYLFCKNLNHPWERGVFKCKLRWCKLIFDLCDWTSSWRCFRDNLFTDSIYRNQKFAFNTSRFQKYPPLKFISRFRAYYHQCRIEHTFPLGFRCKSGRLSRICQQGYSHEHRS
jgi:hypothetical protein